MRYSILWDYTSDELQKDVSVKDLIYAIEKNIFHDQIVERGEFYIFSDPHEKLDESFYSQLEEAGFHITPTSVSSADDLAHDLLVNHQQKQDDGQLVLFSNYLDRLPMVYDFLAKNSHKFNVIHSLTINNNDVNSVSKSYSMTDLPSKMKLKIGDDLVDQVEILNRTESKNNDLIHKSYDEMNLPTISYHCIIKFCSGKEKEVSEYLTSQLNASKSNLVFLKNGVGILEFSSEEDSKNACRILGTFHPSLMMEAAQINESDAEEKYDDEKSYDGGEINEPINRTNNSGPNSGYNRSCSNVKSGNVDPPKSQGFFILLSFKKTEAVNYYMVRIRERLRDIKFQHMYIDPKCDWAVLKFKTENDRGIAHLRLELEKTLDELAFNPESMDELPKYFSRRMELVYRNDSLESSDKKSSHLSIDIPVEEKSSKSKKSFCKYFSINFAYYFIAYLVVTLLLESVKSMLFMIELADRPAR